MAARFVAIDVGKGDAFHLQRGDFSALVDGGVSNGFSTLFATVIKRTKVDVLVCTHNDSDHANGILHYLNSGFGAGECWLPATWLEALDGLLDASGSDAMFDLMLEPDAKDAVIPDRVERSGDQIDAEAVERRLEREADHDPDLDGASLLPKVFWRHLGVVMFPGDVNFELLVDAGRILRIAIAATRQRIPIKWFDPGTMPQQPFTAPLNVVNGADVRSIRKTNLVLRDVLRFLTPVNRDSLVLYSPHDGQAPGVLFSADSGFGFSKTLPADAGMIVTAPHHGSAEPENLHAYARLALEHPALVQTWTWVRSDHASVAGFSRPCDEYRNRAVKFCTHCRGVRSTGQDVIIDGGSGRWTPAPGTSACACTQP